MSSRRDETGRTTLALAIGLAVLFQMAPEPARAEVRVSGQANAIVIEAREARLDEILAALRAQVNLQYQTDVALDRVVTGIYRGTLQRVVARILEGHNYILKSSAGSLTLVVLTSAVAGRVRSTATEEVGRPYQASKNLARPDRVHNNLEDPKAY
jgi:hypothetical protein